MAKSKKIFLLIAMIFALAFVSLGASFAVNTYADGTSLSQISESNFTVTGVSIRVNNDEIGPGVKFHVDMDKTAFESISTNGKLNDDVKTYVLVLPEVLLAEGETIKTTSSKQVLVIDTTDVWFTLDADTMESVAVLYGIPDKYFGVNLAAISYVQVGENKVYSTERDGVSMSYVAQCELDNPNTTLDGTKLQELKDTYLKEYVVTYVVDGEETSLDPIVSGKLIEEPTAPVKENNAFLGWYINDGATKWNFNKNTVSQNVKLYAKWVDTTLNVNLADNYFTGDEINLATTVSEGLTLKVAVNENEVTETTLTLTEAGAYAIKYEVMLDGKVVNTATKTINVYAKEDGNITYFNQPIGLQSIGSLNGCGANITSTNTIDGEGYALDAYLWSPGYWPTITLTNPFVTNLNEVDENGDYLYNYVYFFAMADSSGTSISLHSAAGTLLTKDVWTRILMVRNGTSFTYNGSEVFGYAEDGITANNITGLRITFDTHLESVQTHTYVSALRAVKSLPQLDVEFDSLYFTGDEIDLTPSLTDGYTVKTFVNGEETDSLVANEGGNYTVTYKVFNGNVLCDIVNKTVFVTQKEDGNVTYFNKSFGGSSVGSFNGLNAGVTTAYKYGDEEYSLEAYLQAPGFWPTLKINNPFIKNLNATDENGEYLYDYVYFYAYTTAQKTNIHVESSAMSNYLVANQWNLMLLVRYGDTFNFCGNNVFAGTVTASDITGMQILFNTHEETAYTSVYLSRIMAVKQLPSQIMTVEEDNVTYYNQPAGIAYAKTNAGKLSITNEKTLPGEDYSLKFESPLQSGGYVYFLLANPAISNISQYKYLYFSYYTENAGITSTPGAQWTAKSDNSAGSWKKIVMTNDGNGNFVADGVNAAGIAGGNVDGLNMYFYASTDVVIYISAIRAGNVIKEHNAVINLSTRSSKNEVGNPNALAYGATKTYLHGDDEYVTEFYATTAGVQPTIYLTAPSITNLNVTDENGEYLYDYVYFYVYSTGNATKLGIHYAAGVTVLENGVWTRIVLTRNGNTFYHEGQNIWQTADVTAENITGTQMCFNMTGETAQTSVFMTSWIACKTLPTA